MSFQQFHYLADLLPEALLLVAGDGQILAANPAVADRLGISPSELVGQQLAAWVEGPAAAVAAYLRACSRSRTLLPGTLTLRRGNDRVACRAEGAVFRPRSGEDPALILLRLISKASANQFVTLTQKVEELAQEVKRRRQMADELRQQREWLHVTLSSIGDAVIATDTSSRVTFMNPPAEKLTGWEEAEAMGLPLTEVFHIVNEQTRAAVESPVVRVLQEGIVVGLANHTVLLGRDGVERPIDDCAAPILDGGGRMLGVVLIFHDVSERRALERELAQKAAQLAEENARKDRFLAILSHELRNPLAPIRNSLYILAQPQAPASATEQARRILTRQVQQMSRLIDDLLDVNRINRGQVLLRKESVDLAVIVRHALETTEPILQECRHRLAVTLPQTPVWIEADPVRLEQVLVNLLTNACKFTSPGGSVRLEAEQAGDEAVLRVTDSGMGLATDKLEAIFEPFTHGARTLSSGQQWGLGIGLTIVRALVEQHGGSVRASSDGPGQGSEFTVRLPVLPQSRQPRQTTAAGEPAPGRVRVLVVDDAPDVADSLAEVLRLTGHDARAAHGGPEALAVVAAFTPRVVILDLGMPGMDGLELAQRLRERDPGTVLVAMTGWGQDEVREQTRQAGFRHHLVKPVDPAQLHELLAALLPDESPPAS